MLEIDMTHPKPLIRKAVSAKILSGWRPYHKGEELRFTLCPVNGKSVDKSHAETCEWAENLVIAGMIEP